MKYNKSVRGKLFRYFKQRLGLKKSTAGWWRSNCPHCGGNFCFGIHIQKNICKCFRCEERTDLLGSLMSMENLKTLNEARAFINLQQEYDGYEDTAITRYEKKSVELPDNFHLILIRSGLIGKAAQRYLTKKRGFNLDSLAMKGVGYCTDGEYGGYIIFPFYIKTKLVFFQGRKFMGSGPKMMNPGNEDFGIGKTEIIYNQDALYLYDRINVVESITNALTLGDNTIAILGKSISDYQFKLLLKSPCTHITLLLDDDALDKACKLAMMLCGYKRVRLIRMPKEKDVNDLGKKVTRTLMKNFKYKQYTYFLKLRNKINETSPINSYYRG